MESSNQNKPSTKFPLRGIGGSQKPTAKNLCIIPARGGSKRIPRKNIKDFLGKPIIAYPIEVAFASKLFDEVMVSTDDEEIAEVAIKYGAQVPFLRSEANATDYATTLDVVLEVLNLYQYQNFQNICIIYPTAPFVTVNRLKQGFKKLTYYSAAIPVVAFDYTVWRSFKIEDKKLSYQWPEYEKSRSQDLEPLYHDAGQWYWIKISIIKDTLVPKDTAPVILENMEVQDIDVEADWKMAELKYKALHD